MATSQPRLLHESQWLLRDFESKPKIDVTQRVTTKIEIWPLYVGMHMCLFMRIFRSLVYHDNEESKQTLDRKLPFVKKKTTFDF